jgi:hypothetical protein
MSAHHPVACDFVATVTGSGPATKLNAELTGGQKRCWIEVIVAQRRRRRERHRNE